MTPKQKKVLDFITAFSDRKGFAPSQGEIASGCGFQSLGTVQHYLRLLERDGHLVRKWNGKRSIELTASDAVASGMELPLVGIVAAGKPIEAFQLTDEIEVPPAMAGPENVVYEVRGESMVEMGIMDGDYVAVRPQLVAENGQTVIAELNGSITIKKFVRKTGRIELHPANAAMSPIVVEETDDFHIRGVLIGSMRLYRRRTGKAFI